MSSRKGFTLIEAMLAMVIVTAGLSVLYTAAARSIAIGKKAKEYEVARTLFSTLEYEEPIQLDDVDEDRDSGRFSSPYEDYRWSRTITEYGEESDELYVIETKILWESYNGTKNETLISLLHVPTAKRGGFIDDSSRGDFP